MPYHEDDDHADGYSFDGRERVTIVGNPAPLSWVEEKFNRGMDSRMDENVNALRNPRVYLVQEPLRRAASTGSPVPLFDLSPAKEYGEIVTCLDWSDTKGDFDPDALMDKLYQQLADYSDIDFILPAGNTVAIAMASMIASEVNNGCVKFLLWQKIPLPGKYRVVATQPYSDSHQE